MGHFPERFLTCVPVNIGTGTYSHHPKNDLKADPSLSSTHSVSGLDLQPQTRQNPMFRNGLGTMVWKKGSLQDPPLLTCVFLVSVVIRSSFSLSVAEAWLMDSLLDPAQKWLVCDRYIDCRLSCVRGTIG